MVHHCIKKGRGEELGFKQVKGDQTFDRDPGPSFITSNELNILPGNAAQRRRQAELPNLRLEFTCKLKQSEP
jgi:hypothetical protein